MDPDYYDVQVLWPEDKTWTSIRGIEERDNLLIYDDDVSKKINLAHAKEIYAELIQEWPDFDFRIEKVKD